MMETDLIPQLLKKMNIDALNPMQEQVIEKGGNYKTLILESPTGSGKSLAFLLAILPLIDATEKKLQGLILVPTRELAIQLEGVIQQCGLGLKVHAFYGGYSGQEDQRRLKHTPSLLIGTPGRISSLIEQEHLKAPDLKALVLDEYDKMLELGFEEEMIYILDQLPQDINRQVLTSATHLEKLPPFISRDGLEVLQLEGQEQRLTKFALRCQDDKASCISDLLHLSGRQNIIVFCSFKEDVNALCERLGSEGLEALPFHGDMEQIHREESLIQFRHESSRILIASDLAARGLDVPELDLVIHYQLPLSENSDTHRNGRTARMNAKGAVVYLAGKNDKIPTFLNDLNWQKELRGLDQPFNTRVEDCQMGTVRIAAGRKDKISKGDIVGFFTKVAQIPGNAIGAITLRPKATYIAIDRKYLPNLAKQYGSLKIKKKAARLYLISKI